MKTAWPENSGKAAAQHRTGMLEEKRGPDSQRRQNPDHLKNCRVAEEAEKARPEECSAFEEEINGWGFSSAA